MRLIINPGSLRMVARRLRQTSNEYARIGGELATDPLPRMLPADEQHVREVLRSVSRQLRGLAGPMERQAQDLEVRAKRAEEFAHNLKALGLSLPRIQPSRPVNGFYPFRGTLSTGATGAKVLELQRRLRAAGFDPGPLDGQFGPKTTAAVKAFQRRQGLPVTGVVNSATAMALGLRGAPPAASVATGASSTAGYVWPTQVRIVTSPWGPRWGRMHHGIDIGATTGHAIVAAKEGTVSYAGWYSGYGNTIDIRHPDGAYTRYAHQSRLVAGAGQRVAQRQLIGYVGSSGGNYAPHLHFEIRIGAPFGSSINPLSRLPR